MPPTKTHGRMKVIDTADQVAVDAMRRWRERMGWTQRQAAQALGMTLSGYQMQERGMGFGADSKPRHLHIRLRLACAALERRIEPIR